MEDIVKMLGYFVIGIVLVFFLWKVLSIAGTILVNLSQDGFAIWLLFILAIVIIKRVL